jgi:preprotein translocase subunit SecG
VNPEFSMNIVFNIILVIQILAALAMIGLILVQHGKGADMGAAFGSGGSGSLFGASGSAKFLSRSTAVLAAVFFISTLALAYLGNQRHVGSGSVLERSGSVPATIPAVPRPAAPADQIPGNVPAAGSIPPAADPAQVPAPAARP